MASVSDWCFQETWGHHPAECAAALRGKQQSRSGPAFTQAPFPPSSRGSALVPPPVVVPVWGSSVPAGCSCGAQSHGMVCVGRALRGHAVPPSALGRSSFYPSLLNHCWYCAAWFYGSKQSEPLLPNSSCCTCVSPRGWLQPVSPCLALMECHGHACGTGTELQGMVCAAVGRVLHSNTHFQCVSSSPGFWAFTEVLLLPS